jgi:hypothetical protein
MRAIKYLLIAMAVAPLLVLGIGLLGAAPNPAPQPTHLEQFFDHSQCQYPDRTTNPIDGCDNSDPCDPAATKGGSGECAPTGDDDTNVTISVEGK